MIVKNLMSQLIQANTPVNTPVEVITVLIQVDIVVGIAATTVAIIAANTAAPMAVVIIANTAVEEEVCIITATIAQPITAVTAVPTPAEVSIIDYFIFLTLCRTYYSLNRVHDRVRIVLPRNI
jgi:hypothetical protein